MKVFLVFLLLVSCLVGCMPAKHSYKVTFEDGSTEYYELNYKPKKDAKAIEYDDETIIGVKEIERID